MLGRYSAWYDSVDTSSGEACPGQEGTHKFFGSTLKVTMTASEVSTSGFVFYNSCGKNWLWGSEIVLDATTTHFADNTTFRGINSTGLGNEVHLYGSNLRLFSGNGSALQAMTAILATTGAEVHVHGTGIDVIATKPVNVTAIESSGGLVHASESAYILETAAGGIKTRIKSTGGHDVHAPYLWPGHSTPPDITSQDGSDIAVVTTTGGTPRVVVYSTACTSKWFDVGANACRP